MSNKSLRSSNIIGAVLAFALGWPLSANSSVFLEATFESGRVQSANSAIDGFWIATLPEPQSSPGQYIETGSGGFGPTSEWDTKVVREEIVDGEKVLPRNGNYFMRSAIYLEKDYKFGGTKDVPRSIMNLTNSQQRFDHDEEVWLGFSLFLPTSWEHEQGRNDHRGGAILFAINAMPPATLMFLTQYVPLGQTKAHWFLMVQTSDATAVESGEQRIEYLDLGSVEADLGKWTDFVIRVRSNPFSTTTNPAKTGIPSSLDRTYQGNRGILQLWKSSGSDRNMDLKVDRTNTPVGLVPHATEQLRVTFQVYKYGWRRNPTTVKGPVWVGFDEIRYGSAVRHGTGYSDVDPSRAGESMAAPRPPPVHVE